MSDQDALIAEGLKRLERLKNKKKRPKKKRDKKTVNVNVEQKSEGVIEKKIDEMVDDTHGDGVRENGVRNGEVLNGSDIPVEITEPVRMVAVDSHGIVGNDESIVHKKIEEKDIQVDQTVSPERDIEDVVDVIDTIIEPIEKDIEPIEIFKPVITESKQVLSENVNLQNTNSTILNEIPGTQEKQQKKEILNGKVSTKLVSKMNRVNSTNAALLADRKTLDTNASSLKMDILNLNSEKDNYIRSNEELERKYINLSSTFDNFEGELSILETTLQNNGEAIVKLDNIKKDVSKNYKKELSDLKKEKKQKDEKITELNMRYANLLSASNTIETDTELFHTKYTELLKNLEILKKSKQTILEAKKLKKITKETNDYKIENLEESLSILNQSISKSEDDFSSAKQNSDSKIKKKTHAIEKMDKKNEKIAHIISHGDTDKTNSKLSHENSHLKNQNQHLQNSIKKLSEQQSSLTRQIASEVKRNGYIVREINELKYGIQLQRDSLPPNTQEPTPTQPRPRKTIADETIEPNQPIHQPVQEKESWFTIIPIFGKYWKRPQQPVNTFEVIV